MWIWYYLYGSVWNHIIELLLIEFAVTFWDISSASLETWMVHCCLIFKFLITSNSIYSVIWTRSRTTFSKHFLPFLFSALLFPCKKKKVKNWPPASGNSSYSIPSPVPLSDLQNIPKVLKRNRHLINNSKTFEIFSRSTRCSWNVRNATRPENKIRMYSYKWMFKEYRAEGNIYFIPNKNHSLEFHTALLIQTENPRNYFTNR